jgi:hypothetical protein
LAYSWFVCDFVPASLDCGALSEKLFASNNCEVGFQSLRGTDQLQHSVYDFLLRDGSGKFEAAAQFRVFHVHHVLADDENTQHLY